MSAISPLLYTATEVKSFLPSGWGLLGGGSGRWDAEKNGWSIEVYDGADNAWTIEVRSEEARGDQRLPALKRAIDRIAVKSLGRKSVLTG